VVDTIPVGDAPLGIAIENISFPCPTPFDSMCIETTRIFDSCIFKEERQKTFELPKDQETQCEIIETKCSILDITKIDVQKDYVNVKLQIKVFLSFRNKRFNDRSFKKTTVCFDKNVTLFAPEGVDVCCNVNDATCECIQSIDVRRTSCNKKLSCTVKVTVVVKSKKLIQIEVPLLKTCEPRQC
jgi:hypothetical protein